jgi:hypothetical protein
VAAPNQRTPTGQRLPVALAAVSAVNNTVRTPGRGSGSGSGQRTLRRCPVPQPPGYRPRHRVPRWTEPAAAETAGPSRGRRPSTVSGRRAPRLLRADQPGQAGRHRASGQADRWRGFVDTDRPDRPVMWTPRNGGRGHADTAAAAPLDSRQPNRPPPHPWPCRPWSTTQHLYSPSQSGRSHPARNPITRSVDWQRRSGRLQTDLPCSGGWIAGGVGFRRVQSDRLDDHRDDQAAGGWQGPRPGRQGCPSRAEWPHPYHGSAAKRCAKACLRRWHGTVRVAAMGSVRSCSR